jgi:hypothetical protein
MRLWLRAGFVLLVSLCVSRSAFAQIDLTGEWSAIYHEDGPIRVGGIGPEPGDWSGLPFNDAGRLHGDTWAASVLSVPEHQCMPHVATYSFRGPTALRISKIEDPVTGAVIGLTVAGTYGRADRTIWLDDRPEPGPLERHTWAGFAKGTWAGNLLTVKTTHIKRGWIQRNGGYTSDQATVTDHYVRHGNYLTIVTVVDDPIYLEEPFIRSTNFVLNPSQQIGGSYFCSPFDSVLEVVQPRGYVPHYLPGKNPELTEFHLKNGLPEEASHGGAASLYPEFAQTLREKKPPAEKARAEWNARHLDAAKAAEIRTRAAAGETRQRLSEDYGVSIGTIYSVIAGEIFPAARPAGAAK